MVITTSSQEDISKRAFESLNKYFTVHEDEVVAIEILSPAFQPPDGITMQDGLSIGVPKKVLALAYIAARQQFLANLNSDFSLPAALDATRVMLLFDPEHITAANYRKRRLNALKNGTFLEHRSIYHRALRQELCFLNSILTSPLHRQSKSPTLWFHRICVVEPLMSLELTGATEEQTSVFWRTELTAVCKAGEQHPKNYYAWQYARRFMAGRFSDNIDDIGLFVKDWCCKHPSDISGWSFLWFICLSMRSIARTDLLRNTLDYAINLKGMQESLWVFIRVALAYETDVQSRAELSQILSYYNKDLQSTEYGSVLQMRVHTTIHWIEEHVSTAALGH
ncbi:hypothetical protein ACN47E_003557 [Coniothyrium glycines]